jgi:arsenite-transporting ATPase
MRVLLFTGKGGVGKTTIAAATAVKAAAAGHRTLVMSTDAAHSLADSFDVPIGTRATEIAEGLFAEQIDAQERLEENWREIREYLVLLMDWAGVDAIQAEELSVIPGLDEIFSLIDVKNRYEANEYDLLVVDCAPTAETLRLLSLPEIMNWYIERIFPVERKVVKAVRPLVTKISSIPVADDRFFGAIQRLHANLDAVRRILTDEDRSTIRLVVNPEKMVIAEARRTYTYLSLFGYRVDAVVVNRIIPETVVDPYFAKWKGIQAGHIATVRESFEPIPILTSRLFDREMVGAKALADVGDEVYRDHDPTEVLHREHPMSVKERDHGYLLTMRIPFAGRGDVDVHRKGEELLVRVGQYKRNLLLPAMLQRLEVQEAKMSGDELDIRFAESAPPGAERKGDG